MAKLTHLEHLEAARLELHKQLETKIREMEEWKQLHGIDLLIAKIKGEDAPAGPVFSRSTLEGEPAVKVTPDEGEANPENGRQGRKGQPMADRMARSREYNIIREDIASMIRDKRRPVTTSEVIELVSRRGYKNPTPQKPNTWLTLMMTSAKNIEAVQWKGNRHWWLADTPLPPES